MRREEKAEKIAELSEKLKDRNFYVIDGQGLNVAEVNAFRKRCRSEGISYGVYKNTFIRKALEAQKKEAYKTLSEKALKGFSGLMFLPEAVAPAARLLSQFRKEMGKDTRPQLKAACVDGDTLLGDQHLASLKKWKSKQELVADVMYALLSPIRQVVTALKQPQQKLLGAMETLSKKKA